MKSKFYDLARMTTATHHPAIPTLQWFCADGICPMVINNTLTTRDRDHMTRQYSASLAPLLSLALEPILARLEPAAAVPAAVAPASRDWSSAVASGAG